MPSIELSDEERALWNEAGPRGDAFRIAMRDRAGEFERTLRTSVVIEDKDGTVDFRLPVESPDSPLTKRPA